MRRAFVVALVMLLATVAQAKGKKSKAPAWRRDYNRLSKLAQDQARQGQYARAHKTLQQYLDKHRRNLKRQGSSRDDTAARSRAEKARAGAARFARLDELSRQAGASPDTAVRSFVRALLDKNAGDFRASREERLRALGLLRAHDPGVEALASSAFPMSIRFKWLDQGDYREVEQRALDVLELASKKAGIAVLSRGGPWVLEQELHVAAEKVNVLGQHLVRYQLTGSGRVRDASGELRAEWLMRASEARFDRIEAMYKAAEELATKMLDKLVDFLLTTE